MTERTAPKPTRPAPAINFTRGRLRVRRADGYSWIRTYVINSSGQHVDLCTLAPLRPGEIAMLAIDRPDRTVRELVQVTRTFDNGSRLGFAAQARILTLTSQKLEGSSESPPPTH